MKNRDKFTIGASFSIILLLIILILLNRKHKYYLKPVIHTEVIEVEQTDSQTIVDNNSGYFSWLPNFGFEFS